MDTTSHLKESFLATKSSIGSSESNRASACSLYNVIEADYLQNWENQDGSGDEKVSTNHVTPTMSSAPDQEPNGAYGTFEEELDLESVETLRKKLSVALGKDHEIRGRSCRLLCPVDLIRRICADVVRMSQLEPKGVDGGSLNVRLNFDGCDSELCQLKNEDSENLYEIILTLKEDERRWPDLKQLALMLPNIICCKLSSRRQTMVYVGQGYKLEKVKHYTSHSQAMFSQQ